MNTQDAKRVLETALICAHQPMPLRDMRTLFNDELGQDTLRLLLDEITRDWEDRGVELVALSTGWRFQSRPEMRDYLDRLNPEKPPKYSRATMETLAIIAYRQPVTRGDIEDIRGVTVSSHIVKQLEDRGWIEAIGYREAPGRPALYATTRQFLDDMGLASLDQLPALGAPSSGAGLAEAAAPLQASLLDDAIAAEATGTELPVNELSGNELSGNELPVADPTLGDTRFAAQSDAAQVDAPEAAAPDAAAPDPAPTASADAEVPEGPAPTLASGLEPTDASDTDPLAQADTASP